MTLNPLRAASPSVFAQLSPWLWHCGEHVFGFFIAVETGLSRLSHTGSCPFKTVRRAGSLLPTEKISSILSAAVWSEDLKDKKNQLLISFPIYNEIINNILLWPAHRFNNMLGEFWIETRLILIAACRQITSNHTPIIVRVLWNERIDNRTKSWKVVHIVNRIGRIEVCKSNN